MALYAAQRYTGAAVKAGLQITAASGRTKRRSNRDVLMPSDFGGRIVDMSYSVQGMLQR